MARSTRSMDEGDTALVVNGAVLASKAATLAELLAELGHTPQSVATAVNGAFVPRGTRDQVKLGTGDRVEIVAPRQGG
jgi:sulfur carrier protein